MGCAVIKCKKYECKDILLDFKMDPILEMPPPAQNSEQHILNALDDFCLQKIFRCLETPVDILNVAETCTRFQDNAKQTFPLKFNEIHIGHGKCNRKNRCVYISSPHVRNFLAIFGHLTKCISWSASGDLIDDNQISEMIVQFCGETLKELSINNYSSTFPKEIQFSALEKLTLVNTAPGNLNVHSTLKYFSCDHSGKTLNLSLQSRTYPKLEHLQLRNVQTMTFDKLIQFLSHNRHLRKLDLRGSVADLTMCNSFVRCLSNLEYFEFTFTGTSLESFHHLGDLKCLKFLNIDGIIPLPHIANVLSKNDVPVEELCICLNPEPRILENIPMMRELQKITVEGLHFEELVILVQNQFSLEEIILVRRFGEAQANRNDIDEIKRAFSCSTNLRKIVVTYRRLHPELFTPGILLTCGRILDIVISKIKQVTYHSVDGGFTVAEVTFKLRQNNSIKNCNV